MTVQFMIDAAVKRANGSRRTRTIDSDNVRQCVLEAYRDGFGYVGGGWVANAYRYPAVTSVAFAAKAGDGAVAIAIGVTSAKKSSSPRPVWLRDSVPTVTGGPSARRAMLCWANTPVSSNHIDYQDGAFIFLSRKETRHIVAEYKWASHHAKLAQRSRALKEAEAFEREIQAIPDVDVSTADSIASGNCRSETERVSRELFDGANHINARELIRRIRLHRPLLLSYAMRAVHHAVGAQSAA